MNEIAKPGQVFVCLACGKTSDDKYGDEQRGDGWDEACTLNSVEVEEERLVYKPNSSLVDTILDPK